MADTSNSSMPSFDSLMHLLDDTNLASFQAPNISAKNSIDDSLPVSAVPAELPPIEYCIIPGGTKHGNDMLTDSHGFSYTRKLPKRGASSDTVYWRCAVCNKDVKSNHLDFAQPGIGSTRKRSNLQHSVTSSHLQLKSLTKFLMNMSPKNQHQHFQPPSTLPKQQIITDNTSV